MRYLAALVMTLVGVPAWGDAWFCTAERAAGVLHAERAVIAAEVVEADMRWIVDERGVRRLGDEMPFLDRCEFEDGRPIDCGRSDGQWAGHFSLSRGDVFTSVFRQRDANGTLGTYVAAGRCRRV